MAKRTPKTSTAIAGPVHELPSGPPLPLAEGLAWIDPNPLKQQEYLQHHFVRGHLRRGNLTLEGKPEGSKDSIEIPRSFFTAPFTFDIEHNRLIPLEPIGDRTAYREVFLDRTALRFIKGEIDRFERQNLRECLLARVRNFELTPDQAEAEAKQLGVGPLNPPPDKVALDPMKEIRWTVPMALAWIVWRDPDEVRMQWDKWRGQLYEWSVQTTPVANADGSKGTVKETCLTALMPVHGSCSNLELDVAIRALVGETPQEPPDEAKAALWRSLQDGKLDPDGIDLSTGLPVPIPAREFSVLQLSESRDGEAYLSAGLGRYKYHRPTMSRAEVMGKWPSVTESLSSRKRKAVQKAILKIGVNKLAAMLQKKREQLIIETVQIDSGLKVGERFVRGRLAKARKDCCQRSIMQPSL